MYRVMLETGGSSFLQLAPHTWVAQVHNISQDYPLVRRPRRALCVALTVGSQAENRAWTHISTTRDEHMDLVFDCSNCKQFKLYGACVHTLILQRDTANYLLFTENCKRAGLLQG